MKRLLFLLPLLLFAGVAAYFAIGLGRNTQEIPSALIDRPMPEFALPPLDGLDRPGLARADVAGKVSLVNVFASWCVPCRVEHPVLMRIAEEGKIPLYGISWKDKAADSRAFLAELGNPYARVGWDGNGRVGIDWGVYGVPETYVIGKDGRVRYRHVSPITPDVLERTLLPLIARLERE
jgi:cytochrome c biogenesis protein CcmG/thiol:disulfide interchange protein DsbE